MIHAESLGRDKLYAYVFYRFSGLSANTGARFTGSTLSQIHT